MTSGIYCVEHIATGRKYVGKSSRIERRLSDHKRKAKVLAGEGNYFSAAIRKYGWEAFRWEVLEVVSVESLAERELFWIDYLGVFASERGFNTRRDSSSVTEFSEEVKQKIAAAMRVKPVQPAFAEWHKTHSIGETNDFFGKHHTDATKKVISEKNKLRWLDPEFRAQMAQRPHGPGSTGKVTSVETRRKQSLAKLGRPAKNRGVHPSEASLARMRLAQKQRHENKKLDSLVAR